MVKVVRDVMLPDPWRVDATTSIEQTARLMRSWDATEVPIAENGNLCGLLSAEDIIVIAIAAGVSPRVLTAGECADEDSPRLEADAPVAPALESMRECERRWLPVVDGRQLVGTVWHDDLALALLSESSKNGASRNGSVNGSSNGAHATSDS
jgi:CBS domain-containing protein